MVRSSRHSTGAGACLATVADYTPFARLEVGGVPAKTAAERFSDRQVAVTTRK